MIPLSVIRRYCDTGTIDSMYDSVVVLAHVGKVEMNRSSFELNREYTTQSVGNFRIHSPVPNSHEGQIDIGYQHGRTPSPRGARTEAAAMLCRGSKGLNGPNRGTMERRSIRRCSMDSEPNGLLICCIVEVRLTYPRRYM